MTNETHCGFVAIIGRPNVGKSTLLNRILGEKVAITSHKPQTTRQNLHGVSTHENTQIVYIDTPGIHSKAKTLMNRYMNRQARSAFDGVDAIIWLVVAGVWTQEDELVLRDLIQKKVEVPVILVVNKIDTIKNTEELLPYLEERKDDFDFAAMIPISAQKGHQVDKLQEKLRTFLTTQPFYFPADMKTNQNDAFHAAEFLREKLMRRLSNELPYALAVTIEKFSLEENDILHIYAIIWVDKTSQKGIVIGKQGDQLKQVSTEARIAMEQFFKKKVFLRAWVKVKPGWSDSSRDLTSMGYQDK